MGGMLETWSSITIGFGRSSFATIEKDSFCVDQLAMKPRPFRMLRRGLFVRHINDGQASHRLSVENVLGIVYKLIAADQPKEGGE